MKNRPAIAISFLFIVAVSALTLRADDTNAAPATSDDDPAAHQGYNPSRYEELWTKSPFSVATPEENVTESAEYSLVGVAQLGGVDYASLIEKQNGNHVLVSSDKPLSGLTLNSVSKKSDGGTYATLNRNGEILTLKLETAAAGVAGSPGMQPGGMSNGVFGSPPMPGNVQPYNNNNFGMPGGGQPMSRPLIRIHRPIIHVPPRIQTPNNSAPAPAPLGNQ